MKKNLFILIIFILALGFLIGLPSGFLTPENIRYVRLAGQSVRVDLAISAEAQARGLSDRTGLPDGEGLLFIFNQPGKHMFWMRDMRFPIDIIWISPEMRVVHMEKNVAPESFPQSFGPNIYTKYVLEVPAGFADKYNLQIGNRALFTE